MRQFVYKQMKTIIIIIAHRFNKFVIVTLVRV